MKSFKGHLFYSILRNLLGATKIEKRKLTNAQFITDTAHPGQYALSVFLIPFLWEVHCT